MTDLVNAVGRDDADGVRNALDALFKRAAYVNGKFHKRFDRELRRQIETHRAKSDSVRAMLESARVQLSRNVSQSNSSPPTRRRTRSFLRQSVRAA